MTKFVFHILLMLMPSEIVAKKKKEREKKEILAKHRKLHPAEPSCLGKHIHTHISNIYQLLGSRLLSYKVVLLFFCKC